jgi:hypothetical protein
VEVACFVRKFSPDAERTRAAALNSNFGALDAADGEAIEQAMAGSRRF